MRFTYLLLTILLSLLFPFTIQAQCWNLVWEDEFDGSTLDLNKWEYQIGGGGWGNNELQYYTAGDNVAVSNGTLKITAEEDVANQYPGNAYTSSRIRTRYQGDWRYGKMEASIKLPFGQGIWPAFWMMPTHSVYGGWPTSGEIDIMEYLGHQTSTTYATCHYGNAWNDKSSSGGWTNLPSGTIFPDDFHTFSIEWEPTQIRWYLDGVQFHVANSTDPDFNTYNWPFDQHFHFILNVAVGGNWPGAPDGNTVFPQTMEVEWVRVYQQLPDIEIAGEVVVEPAASGLTYRLPDVSGATYNWIVPFGTTILSGQGTSLITVDWGTISGTVSADLTTPCGTQSYALDVVASPNLWLNYNFEEGMNFWSNNEFNGASANFDLVTTNVQEGTTSVCVTPTNLAANTWDIQLGRNQIDLVAGENYTLTFWAKANQMGQDINLAFINSTTFAGYANTAFNVTDTWAQYTFSFTAPTTANALFNLDLGDELGTFCFDDFSFALTSTLNTIRKVNLRVLLEGAYVGGGEMNTTLLDNNKLPLTQPYATAPWNYAGTESVVNFPADVTDWVLVELRDLNNPELWIATRAAFLRKDGVVIDLDGSNGVAFSPNQVAAGDYYVVVRHRNHLSILSANTVTVPNGASYDFTTAQTQASGSEQLTDLNDGNWGMYSGDINGDGILSVADFNIYLSETAAVNMYLPSDVNLDQNVTTADFNLYLPNSSLIGVAAVRY